jgi:hypothetical protein
MFEGAGGRVRGGCGVWIGRWVVGAGGPMPDLIAPGADDLIYIT